MYPSTRDNTPSRIVLVQVISSIWTKSARGDPLATRRNNVPEALPIPPTSLSGRDLVYIIHHVRYDETNAFMTPVQNDTQVEPFTKPLYLEDSNVVLQLLDGDIRVDLHWRWGAPRRRQQIGLFTLTAETWVQIQYNYRTGGERAWRYCRDNINVGLTTAPDPQFFVASPPRHRYTDLVDLW
ncbi:MAG: hypothetical protein ACTHMJ_23175 [Thermomicrobiales bacterium]